MAITTYPHIIEAVRNTANPKDKTAFRDLAGEMDVKESSLGNMLNPYGDRDVVKLGLEQTIHIMKCRSDFSALHLLAAECGFALIPLYSKPDKATVEAEMLDDVQSKAKYQSSILCNLPAKERVLHLAGLLDEVIQTETAKREDEGRVFKPGIGWVDASICGGEQQ